MITDYAGPDDQTYVWARLQKILVANCLVPAEDGPCALRGRGSGRASANSTR